MKRRAAFALCLAAILCTGCWDRIEVDQLAIVVGLGIDRLPGKSHYLLTAQVVNPSVFQKEGSGGGGSKQPFIVKYAEGSSLYDAVRNFSMDSPRRMFFSHNNVIVLGDSLARSGIQELLDYAERDPRFRRTTLMLVTPGTAKEIMEAKLDFNNLPGIGITEMISEFQQSKAQSLTQRKDFMKNLLGKSQSTFATAIDLVDQKSQMEQELSQVKGNVQKYGGEQVTGESAKQLRITGLALFRKDRLVGYMNDAENRGMLWMLGKLRGGSVTLPCPDNSNGKISLQVNETKLKLKPSYEGKRPNMLAEIEEESTLTEVGCPEMDVDDPNTIKQIEQLQNHDVEKRVKETVSRAQKLKSDIFKFGDSFHSKDPKKWKTVEADWPEQFAKIRFRVKVDSRIRHTGMTGRTSE